MAQEFNRRNFNLTLSNQAKLPKMPEKSKHLEDSQFKEMKLEDYGRPVILRNSKKPEPLIPPPKPNKDRLKISIRQSKLLDLSQIKKL